MVMVAMVLMVVINKEYDGGAHSCLRTTDLAMNVDMEYYGAGYNHPNMHRSESNYLSI